MFTRDSFNSGHTAETLKPAFKISDANLTRVIALLGYRWGEGTANLNMQRLAQCIGGQKLMHVNNMYWIDVANPDAHTVVYDDNRKVIYLTTTRKLLTRFSKRLREASYLLHSQ